jgi:hypothetical protein
MAQIGSAAELQWRRGRPPEAGKVAEANSQFRRDTAVRPATWDASANGGPGLSSASDGHATLRSVVVNRNDGDDSMRSAQLSQSTSGVSGQGTTGTGTTGPSTSGPTTTSPRSNITPAPPSGSPARLDPARPFGAGSETQRPFTTPQLGTPEPIQLPTDRGTLPPPTSGQPGGASDDFQLLPPGGTGTTPDRTPITPGSDLATAQTDEAQARDVCSQQLAALQSSRLADVNLDIRVTGTAGLDYPYHCSIDNGTWHAGRCWPGTTYMWKASALCHKPLYFEDEQMERYGHSWGPCCDPIVSGVHFFATLPVLPYCMGVEPPCECIYALGHYRPGSCAPYYIEPVPISCRGALFQAGAVTGAAAILP